MESERTEGRDRPAFREARLRFERTDEFFIVRRTVTRSRLRGLPYVFYEVKILAVSRNQLPISAVRRTGSLATRA